MIAKIGHSLDGCSILVAAAATYNDIVFQYMGRIRPAAMVICGDLTSWVGSVMPSLWQWPKAVDGDGDDVCRLICRHGLGHPGD